MPKYYDRAEETTTTTGTGAYTSSGSAVAGNQTFAAATASAATVLEYCVTDGTDWETVLGTFDGTTGFTRNTILSSSNSGNAVNWGVGSKNIWSNFGAKASARAGIGRQVAQANKMGWV